MIRETAKKNHDVFVVLGPGRSGTSLVMQALVELGAGISSDLIRPNDSNPKGFFEDAEIVQAHKNLMEKLGASPYLPLPENWLNADATRKSSVELTNILKKRIRSSEKMWSFKDPRTAAFLPLWHEIFDSEGVDAKYILAMREPASIIKSFVNNYGANPKHVELTILQRLLDSIYYTKGNLTIISYEKWFTNYESNLSCLKSSFKGKLTNTCQNSFLSSDLNRNNKSNVKTGNYLLDYLYESICLAEKENNSKKLFSVAEEIKEIVYSLRLWSNLSYEAKTYKQSVRRFSEKDKKFKESERINNILKSEIESLSKMVSSLENLNSNYDGDQ